MPNQDVVAIIPARGASKRLPRKNLAPFFGKSLLQRSIEACQASREITQGVYVSTEDAEIAQFAHRLGAKVIPRPNELAEDDVWTQAVIQHSVEYLENNDVVFDNVARIYCSPQVQATKIDEAIRLLKREGLWEVFSVNEDGVDDAVIRIIRKKSVWQKALSVYMGVVRTNYVDIHTQEDLDILEQQRLEKIETDSISYLEGVEKKLRHSSLYQELLYVAGRPKKLWSWQLKIPLAKRWQAIVQASDELANLLYSPTGHDQSRQIRVLDVGCGFGMYWPILREFGVSKFVGVDLFDLRRPETYYQAAQDYVKKFCGDCQTQLIMDDARNLSQHNLLFDSFDVVLAVATASTKLGSTAIPRDLFNEIVDRYGAKDCIPVYVESV